VVIEPFDDSRRGIGFRRQPTGEHYFFVVRFHENLSLMAVETYNE